MLELKDVVKEYKTADETVAALKGVSLKFRKSEFVSILGPSGCGKTTLLNIIGGLDRYTSGDLIINGKSTKDFSDKDWDTYRNHSVGFVFQSYNLIPHQTVLENVELALTLSGIGAKERRERAVRQFGRYLRQSGKRCRTRDFYNYQLDFKGNLLSERFLRSAVRQRHGHGRQKADR